MNVPDWDDVAAEFEQDVADDNNGMQFINPNALQHKVVWDITPDHLVDGTLKRLGLTPASEDVKVKEAAAYEKRVIDVTPIHGMMMSLSNAATNTVYAYLCEKIGEEEAAEYFPDLAALNQVIVSSNRSAIIELVDIGLLQLPPMTVGIPQ